MPETKIYYCMSCGGALNVDINRSFVFCQFCGCKNEISSHEMQTNINIGGINIHGKTDLESMLSSAQYAISIKQYDKANEMLMAAILSGTNDHRIYILKSKIDLLTDDNKSLFESLYKLRELENAHGDTSEISKDICELMKFRGMNGVTALHIATFHELYDMVVYCVEHNSDVNCIAGMNRVTPISIMFVNVSQSLQKIDGTPFIRDKNMVKTIRKYLLSKGAIDKFRLGY